MKKAMYFIEFETLDTEMSTRLPISKKEFQKNLKFLKEQVTHTQHNETPLDPMRKVENETTSVITTYYYFMCGCTTTTLVSYECKPGYTFKTK